jgi:hypothetical protein
MIAAIQQDILEHAEHLVGVVPTPLNYIRDVSLSTD